MAIVGGATSRSWSRGQAHLRESTRTEPHGQGSRPRARQDHVGRTAAHASVLRAELRRFGAIDFDKGGSGTEAYILHANELYEVATAFPTGANIDDVYDWIGATSVAHREPTYPTGAKGKLMAMLTAIFGYLQSCKAR